MLGNFNINHNWRYFLFLYWYKVLFQQLATFKSFSTGLWIMQFWSINYTLCLKHGQKHKHCFYWIVCSTGIFKKFNLALLAYQNIVGVGFVNCTTYVWHVPKLRKYLCLRVFRIVIYGKCFSNWLYFLAFFWSGV